MLAHLTLTLLVFIPGIIAADPDPFRAVVIDCKTCPHSCNNDCFAVYAAGQPSELRYGGPNTAETNHPAGPCGICTCDKTSLKYHESGDSCVEYPFASTLQGGMRAIGRCVPSNDSADQQKQLDAIFEKQQKEGGCKVDNELKACNIIVFLKNYSEETPFCTGKPNTKPKNDGFEFKLKDDQVIDARDMQSRAVPNGLEDVPLNPEKFIGLHMRREFVMSDGSRILALTGDQDSAFAGYQVLAANGDSVYIVRELLGEEKTAGLRSPTIS